jgi:hypothetical protein
VDQVVALVQRQRPALLLQRPETGEVDLPLVGIGSEELAQEPDVFIREMPHDFLEALALCRVAGGRPTQHVLLGAIGDVFVTLEVALALREQELAVGLGKVERRFFKIDHPPRLDLLAVMPGALGLVGHVHPTLRVLVIVHAYHVGVGDGLYCRLLHEFSRRNLIHRETPA